jgi:DNA polymerase III subunit gamma/tau
VTQEPSRSGQDPIGDFQRWLVRSGARSVSREVSDQIRSMLGRGAGPADVWSRATAPPADEAPECAWCPICRAARVLRESGPGVSSQMSAAGEAVGVLARDAMSVFESAVAATGRAARAGTGQGQAPSSSVWADVTAADPGEPAADPEEPPAAPQEPAAGPQEPVAGPGEPAAGPGEPAAGPAEGPEAAGPTGGPPHEPDDRG